MAKTIYVDGSTSSQRNAVSATAGTGKGTATEPYENIFQIEASELDAGGNNVINVAGDILINKQTVGETAEFNFLINGASGNQNILQQWAGKPKARLIQAYRLDNNPDFQWVERDNGEFSLHPSGPGQERGDADINYQDTATVNGYYRTRSKTVPIFTSAERQMAGSKTDAQRSIIGSLNELDIGVTEVMSIPDSDINAGTNVITETGHQLVAGDKVRYKAPSGGTAMSVGGELVSYDTQFFVIASGLTANAFKLSATSGGSEIDITNAGSGTHIFGYNDFPVETPFFKPEAGKSPDDYEIYLGTGQASGSGAENPSYLHLRDDYWTIDGITFYHGSRSNFALGAQDGAIIQNCVFSCSESYGIESSTSSGVGRNTIIRNCVFSNNGVGFIIFNAQTANNYFLNNNVFHRSNGVLSQHTSTLTLASANGTGTNQLTIDLPAGHTVVAGKKVYLAGFANGSSSGTVINGLHTVDSLSTNTAVVTISGVTASDDGAAAAGDTRTAQASSKTNIYFRNNLCVMQDEYIKSQFVGFDTGVFTESNNYYYMPFGSKMSHTSGNWNETNNNTSNTSYPPSFDTTTQLRAGSLASKFKGSRALGDPILPNPVAHLDSSDYYKCDFHPTPESLLIMGGTTASSTIAQGADFEGVYFSDYPNIGIYQTSSDGNPNGTARTADVARTGGKTLPKSIFAPLIAATVSEAQSHTINIKPFEEIEVQCNKRLAKGEFISASNGLIVIGRGKEFGVIKNVTGNNLRLTVTKSVTRTPVSVTYS